MRTTFAGLLNHVDRLLTGASVQFQQGNRRSALGHLGRAVGDLRLARPLATTPVHVQLCERRMGSVNALLTEYGYSRVDAPEFEIIGPSKGGTVVGSTSTTNPKEVPS